MMSREQNERVTRTGADTPAGKWMRAYWQPVALTDELDGPRPLRPVGVLGEDLVLFRDESGRCGLLARHCPHRGADLCYGRLEDGGLRCAFHGWLFGSDGECLEQPAEPAGSTYHARVRQLAYPCEVRNGIVFAWLGEGEPPPFPALDCFRAPASHSFAFKGLIECNWLQALEVGIDPAHASFLHRYLADDDPAAGYGLQFRDLSDGADLPLTAILRRFPTPRIEVEDTDYGLRIITVRDLHDGTSHVRVTNQVLPHAVVIPMSREMTITQWHVPIDDRRCYWYAIFTSFDAPVDHDLMRKQRLALYQLPDYVPRVGRASDYGYDSEEQRTRTFTGMGEDINVHDQWAVESMGPIQDRTREHLGRSDVAIRAYRRRLLAAIEAAEGERAVPFARSAAPAAPGPVAIDAIAPSAQWRRGWLAAERRRRAAPWATEPTSATAGHAGDRAESPG